MILDILGSKTRLSGPIIRPFRCSDDRKQSVLILPQLQDFFSCDEKIEFDVIARGTNDTC